MSIFIILVNPKGLLDVIIVIGAFVIIYLFFILILRGINNTEIDFLKSMIK